MQFSISANCLSFVRLILEVCVNLLVLGSMFNLRDFPLDLRIQFAVVASGKKLKRNKQDDKHGNRR